LYNFIVWGLAKSHNDMTISGCWWRLHYHQFASNSRGTYLSDNV